MSWEYDTVAVALGLGTDTSRASDARLLYGRMWRSVAGTGHKESITDIVVITAACE